MASKIRLRILDSGVNPTTAADRPPEADCIAAHFNYTPGEAWHRRTDPVLPARPNRLAGHFKMDAISKNNSCSLMTPTTRPALVTARRRSWFMAIR